MALLADRVKDTSTTTGTGTLTLANSAPTGFRTFGSAFSDGSVVYYCIQEQSGSGWEVGIGTYTSSGTTLSRTTILASSNAGAAVNFGAGTKDVFCTAPADLIRGSQSSTIYAHKHRSTFYHRPGRATGGNTGNVTFTADRLYGVEFVVPVTCSYDRIVIRVTTAQAATNARLGIYSPNVSTGLPDALLLDAGTVTTDTTGDKAVTISQTLAAGIYWLALVADNSTVLISGLALSEITSLNLGIATALNNSPASHVFGTHTYGALPSTFPAISGSATTMPMIALRAT